MEVKTQRIQRENPLIVINLFGTPGVGKSATRSGLFWLMKVKQMSVEEVSEYAKYLVLSNRLWQLNTDQLYILAKQHHKLLVVEDNLYDFAVTDSPLMLSSFYALNTPTPEPFYAMCEAYFHRFENFNVFLHRDLSKNYEEKGRLQTWEESLELEEKQKTFLRERGISWVDIDVDYQTPWKILEAIERQYPDHKKNGGPALPIWTAHSEDQ